MRRVWNLTLAAFVFSAGAAFAQSSEEECQKSYSAAAPLLSGLRAPNDAPQKIEIEDGWCVAYGVNASNTYPNAPALNFRRLAWQGETSDGSFPASFDIVAHIEPGRATGISSMPGRAAASRNAVMLNFRISNDTAAKKVSIDQLSFDFPGENSISLAMDLDGVDLSSASAFRMSMISMKFTRLRLGFESDGRLKELFESTFGPLDPLTDQDRNKAMNWIKILPNSLLSQDSRGAAIRLLSALPDPRGDAMLELSSDAGFSPARFAVFRLNEPGGADLTEALEGLTFEVSYQP